MSNSLPDPDLDRTRTTGIHLPAGIYRSPSKGGAVWDARHCVISGAGCPYYTTPEGTRIVGPTREGDMPPALLTLRGFGVTVRDLGFWGEYPPLADPWPINELPTGLAIKLLSGTGKMILQHLSFWGLKIGVDIGGGSANENCDQITAEQLYFHNCQIAWKTGQSQSMGFQIGQVEINGCGVGFDMAGSNLSVGMAVVLGTGTVIVNRRDNPSVSDEIHKLIMDAQPLGRRTVLFSQPLPGRSCTTFRHATWPLGHSTDRGQPMVEVNHGARVVFLDSTLPAANLVSALDGGSPSANAMPAVVEFHRCGFWPGWSPTKAFPMTQRLGKYRVVFRECYDAMTLLPLPDQVVTN